ncbi:MAG: N-acetylmuramoyl-L-alanine amidase [Bacteroidia bacterium]|nr:N-acetylmuramoyl-L-alanine amidase [Bacteroidia bacterium]
MQKILSFFLLCLSFLGLSAQNFQIKNSGQYQSWFAEAYALYPAVPKGMLEAVAFSRTRMQHITPDPTQPSCTGIPQVFGVMGLVEDGKGYFRNNLQKVASLSGYPVAAIKADPRTNILAYAAAWSALNQLRSPDAIKEQNWYWMEENLSELPLNQGKNALNYSFMSHFYQVLQFMSSPEMQKAFVFPDHQIDCREFFGENNFAVLSASRVTLTDNRISGNGHELEAFAVTGPDYAPALWDPAPTCNYSSRNGTSISAVTIHDTEGSYASAISWFKNCNSSVSAHYVIRSWDGQVTQMVLEQDKAWHVGSENPYTIGIEHEGFYQDASWYSNQMYAASADLVKDIIQSGYGINGLKTYYGPPTSGIQTLSLNCYKIKGHQHYPNQSHVDPGLNWDWERYYRLINGTPAPTTYTSCSGTFYDAGGSSANYGNQERKTWLISPSGAAQTSLTFSSFDLESNYDYLYIYDGNDTEGELLGKFSGNTIPGPFTANTGSFYLEFRSDCATTKPGWAGSWTCTSTTSSCPTPTGLAITNLNPFGATAGWNAVSGATSYELRYRHSLQTTWTTVALNGTTLNLTGLASDAEYVWQVRTLCGTGISSWDGGTFQTPSPTNSTNPSCAGNFRDSGGDLGNYTNSESYTFTINPAGASSITLTFSQFSLENNYDFLTIYDGPGTGFPSLGTFTGTNSPGTVVSSGGALTVKFTSDTWTTKSGWDAVWQCGYNQAPNTQISMTYPWVSTDFAAKFTDTDNSGQGIASRFYQVIDFDGQVWDANRGNGFLFETFTGGWNSAWTETAGYAYLLNDALHQTDTVVTNSNWYIDVAQNAATDWLFNWKGRMWNGAQTTNRRFGLHFFVDSPTATNRGNSYLVWFRADNQTVEIYETINDVLYVRASQAVTIDPFVWYDFKATYSPATGKIKVYQEDQLLVSWTDTSPLQTGSHVSLRTNQAHCDFDNLRVFKSRPGGNNPVSQQVLVGPASNKDVRYQSPNLTTPAGRIFSEIVDVTEHWSNLDQHDIFVDWTPPTLPNPLADGPGTDIDTTWQNSSLTANWGASVDTNSAIQNYLVAIGTTAGGTDILNWTDNADTIQVTVNGLSLTAGIWYYFSVEAFNLSGLGSGVVNSDGQVVATPVGLDPGDESWQSMILYPVPAKEKLAGRISTGNIVEIGVYGLDGKLLNHGGLVKGNAFEFQLDGLPGGIYFVRVRDDQGNLFQGKFQKF